ncbi:hypothetical protein WN944_003003 [Citrus x changshan-huyou]|uniref:Uncharacterized protein n=1 Tax=Citrus x changshan-huyou TaxID=2935761 RepID=A0AAP0MME4_9ROSI
MDGGSRFAFYQKRLKLYNHGGNFRDTQKLPRHYEDDRIALGLCKLVDEPTPLMHNSEISHPIEQHREAEKRSEDQDKEREQTTETLVEITPSSKKVSILIMDGGSRFAFYQTRSKLYLTAMAAVSERYPEQKLPRHEG